LLEALRANIHYSTIGNDKCDSRKVILDWVISSEAPKSEWTWRTFNDQGVHHPVGIKRYRNRRYLTR